MTKIYKNDNLTVYQFLQFIRLQLENGYNVNDEFEVLYRDYKEYCERNTLIPLSHREFAYQLNKMGIPSTTKWDGFEKKSIITKKIDLDTVNEALEELGGDLIVENIYTIIDGKRYQMSIKLIPLATPTIRDLERESKEVNMMKVETEGDEEVDVEELPNESEVNEV